MSDDANPLDPLSSTPASTSYRIVASAVFAPLGAFDVETPALVLASVSGGAPQLHCGAADRAFAVRERGIVTDTLRRHRFHVDEPWTSDLDGSVDFHTAAFVADQTTLAVLMIVDRRDDTSLIVLGFRRDGAPQPPNR
jgi:hypothetical protein